MVILGYAIFFSLLISVTRTSAFLFISTHRKSPCLVSLADQTKLLLVHIWMLTTMLCHTLHMMSCHFQFLLPSLCKLFSIFAQIKEIIACTYLLTEHQRPGEHESLETVLTVYVSHIHTIRMHIFLYVSYIYAIRMHIFCMSPIDML